MRTGKIGWYAVVGMAVGLWVMGQAWGAEGGLPETVPVGNPGNDADSTGYGAVAYEYRIGKYEVTNAQYCEFLNAVAKTDTHHMYRREMAGEYGGILRSGESGDYTYTVKDGWGNKPVNFVSWYDALRYANWLTNGRGSGSTETGSYTFTKESWGWEVAMPDHAALAAEKEVKWVLASEDEWYKAAYYDPDKSDGAGYWRYPARSDSAPAAAINSAPADVGSYSASAYGTYEQGGNMWEWNETQSYEGNCGVRGGSWYINDQAWYMLSSARWVTNPPTFRFANYGFRVVALGGSVSE